MKQLQIYIYMQEQISQTKTYRLIDYIEHQLIKKQKQHYTRSYSHNHRSTLKQKKQQQHKIKQLESTLRHCKSEYQQKLNKQIKIYFNQSDTKLKFKTEASKSQNNLSRHIRLNTLDMQSTASFSKVIYHNKGNNTSPINNAREKTDGEINIHHKYNNFRDILLQKSQNLLQKLAYMKQELVQKKTKNVCNNSHVKNGNKIKRYTNYSDEWFKNQHTMIKLRSKRKHKKLLKNTNNRTIEDLINQVNI